MAERSGTGHRTRSVGALWRPSIVAVTLGAALFVPVGTSSASTDPEGPALDLMNVPGVGDIENLGDILLDETIEQVGGLLLASDPAPMGPYPAESLGDGDPGVPSEAAPTIGEALSLHSRPGATRTILLDFDGEFVDSPHWNGDETIDALPYSSGNGEGFSASDLSEIEEIWTRVAEDFAPWDVDVTTEDPGADALAKSEGDDVDDEYGVRVIISPSYEWYSTGRFGGVAYLDTFDRFDDLPGWVFSDNLSSPKSVAEAASHEAGHTLGLSHDGISTTDSGGETTSTNYYSGHGVWAPIMGLGYERPITQWSNGDYPGATTTQDDLSIIGTYLDRLGASSSASTAVASVIGPEDSTSTHVLANGGQIDAHTLQIETGPVTVSVERVQPEGNLLAEMRILDPSGQVVASAEPANPTSWALDVTLPAGAESGSYTVEVESIGWTPSDNPGFSSYASIGGYVLDIDAPGTSGGDGSTPPTVPPGPGPESDSAGDRLTATTPRRVLDTRQAGALVAGPIPAGQDQPIAINGLPADATAVVVNLTVVAPRGNGFFSLTPCGVTGVERTSSLNFESGRNIANSVIVPLSRTGATAGQICLFSSVPTHALLDVTGWIGASGELSLEQLGSARLVDTRAGTGIGRRLPANVATPISLAGVLGSDTIGAVALNVTAVRPSNGGFLTIDDCSAGQQPTSSLNFIAGEIRGNNGIFALGQGQQLCVTSSTATDVTIDVTGEFGTAAGLTFVPSTSPERILDTRDTGRLSAGGTTTFDVDTAAGSNALQRSPVAASINLTATRHDDSGFVTAWSCGQRPSTSALNPSAGTATANGALVELSRSGTTCLFHATGGHLIVDLAGWWI